MGELIFMLNFYKCISKTYKITENCLQSKRVKDLTVKFLNLWYKKLTAKCAKVYAKCAKFFLRKTSLWLNLWLTFFINKKNEPNRFNLIRFVLKYGIK
ncbi:hypothetical protein OA88_03890 [Flavobacterium sp. JRM]|nr:hypothetical protein OA88_03890 [Flavobacterium sp. JRM]